MTDSGKDTEGFDFRRLSVWVLSDGKAGHENQSLGVSEALGIEAPRIRSVHLRRYGRFLRWLGPGVALASLPKGPYPDLVISTGRTTELAIKYIKQKSPETFAVQMMSPGQPVSRYDVVAAPLHDASPPRPNIITTLGAPNRLTRSRLNGTRERWKEKLGRLKEGRIAVLVGGDSRAYRFGLDEAKRLLVQVRTLQERTGAQTLMMTTSRRTRPEVVRFLVGELKSMDSAHVWTAQDTTENPYMGYLAWADRVVVTVESVSMVSEACSTGRPVYVFEAEKARHMGKFKHFHAALMAQGHVVPLSDVLDFSDVQKEGSLPPPLAEAARVAAFVKVKYAERAAAVQGRSLP